MKLILYFLGAIVVVSFANAKTLDSTEVAIAEFSEFVASSRLVTYAEQHGGMVYEGGWVMKDNWNWRTPYGSISQSNESVVHVTYSEAEQYCEWNGKRLPTKEEWIDTGYTERRVNPTDGYMTEETYPYPTVRFQLEQIVCWVAMLKHFLQIRK